MALYAFINDEDRTRMRKVEDSAASREKKGYNCLSLWNYKRKKLCNIIK